MASMSGLHVPEGRFYGPEAHLPDIAEVFRQRADRGLREQPGIARIQGKELHCEFDGVETVINDNGKYCCVPLTHKVTLGEIVDLLQEFKNNPDLFNDPNKQLDPFAKKLYSLYLSYLPNTSV